MTAIFCTNCGTPRDHQAVFCGNCGNRFEAERRCPTCNQIWEAGQPVATGTLGQDRIEGLNQLAEPKFAYGDKYRPKFDCENCGNPNAKDNCSLCE